MNKIQDEMQALVGDGAEDMLAELAPMFLEDATFLMGELATAVTTATSTRIRETAHTLKGSSASLGIRRFSRLCYEMELMGRENDLLHAAEKLAQIQAEYAAVITALGNYLSP
ncbi:MAG: Hpt domain-containing protein [Anaerolineales bacterium]|nr:Hpt domain-containing protein [Anaerolineales bacterium]MCB9004156.1 Hpt domain-containing protein [Ardenticatenaceae bacterium]